MKAEEMQGELKKKVCDCRSKKDECRLLYYHQCHMINYQSWIQTQNVDSLSLSLSLSTHTVINSNKHCILLAAGHWFALQRQPPLLCNK